MVRSAYTLRADDDSGQAGTLVRDVMNDAERDAWCTTSLATSSRSQRTGTARAFDYWRNVDTDLGNRIEKSVRQ